MPLTKSSSDAAFKDNLLAELGAKKPKNQALAIAYDVQRKNRADGGMTVRGPQSLGENVSDWMHDHNLPTSVNKSDIDMNPMGVAAVGRAAFGGGASPNSIVDQGFNVINARTVPDKAFGGSASSENWLAHSALRGMQQNHAGPINSSVAGRTDHIPLNVASGSYVVPADIVSGLGQGNTAAGHQIINKMFHSGPYEGALGSTSRAARPTVPRLNLSPRPPKLAFADGGSVPIMAAGGEHVLIPAQVAQIGGGDLKHGHEILDAWIKHERNKINKEQKKLPGPAKD